MFKKPTTITVLFLTFGFILASILLLFLLIKFWPVGETDSTPKAIAFFGIEFNVSYEKRLIIAILITGAIGGLIHSLTSFVEYVCNRKFKDNWTIWYLTRPFIGMLLALVFYFVVRAGFFTRDFQAENINEIGFLAIAALSGMFSKQATDKLKEVFDNIFHVSKKVERSDPLENPTPEVENIKPNQFPAEQKEIALEIQGDYFVEKSTVFINGSRIPSQFVSEQQLTGKYQITEKDLEKGLLEVYVKNPLPGGGNSNIFIIEKRS